MTDAFLVELKAVFDALTDRADLDDAPPTDRSVMERALPNFKSRGSEVLDDVTPYLWRYCRRTADAFSPVERATYGIPDLDPSHNIWDEVTFRFEPIVALGGNPLEPAPCYLSFEGEVSWEPEHGLQLVFENGLTVCKVGPYDGHNTNAHAYADASLLNVVFK